MDDSVAERGENGFDAAIFKLLLSLVRINAA